MSVLVRDHTAALLSVLAGSTFSGSIKSPVVVAVQMDYGYSGKGGSLELLPGAAVPSGV